MHCCATMQVLLRAMNSETRMDALRLLLEKDDCVCHLAEKLRKDISTMSRHIEILEGSGLLKTWKEGRMLMCRIKRKDDLRQMIDLIERLEAT